MARGIAAIVWVALVFGIQSVVRGNDEGAEATQPSAAAALITAASLAGVDELSVLAREPAASTCIDHIDWWYCQILNTGSSTSSTIETTTAPATSSPSPTPNPTTTTPQPSTTPATTSSSSTTSPEQTSSTGNLNSNTSQATSSTQSLTSSTAGAQSSSASQSSRSNSASMPASSGSLSDKSASASKGSITIQPTSTNAGSGGVPSPSTVATSTVTRTSTKKWIIRIILAVVVSCILLLILAAVTLWRVRKRRRRVSQHDGMSSFHNDNATVYTRFTRSDMRESSFTPGIPRYSAGGRGPGHSPIESPVDAQSHTDSYASDDTLSPGGLHNATALNSPSRRILGFLGTAHHISFLPQPAPTDAASATLSAGRPALLAARPLDGSVVMTGDAPSLPIQYPDLHTLTLSGLAASPVDISPAWSPMSPASGNHVSGVWHPIPFASSPTALATQPYPSEKQDTAGAQPSILAESPTVPLPSATFETDTPRTARDSRRRAEDGGISLAGGPHRPRSAEGPDAQSVLDSFDGGSYQTLPPAYGAY